MQLQKIRILREYLTNFIENFTVHTFEVAEQLYLVVKGQFTLTKVLYLRSEYLRRKKKIL